MAKARARTVKDAARAARAWAKAKVRAKDSREHSNHPKAIHAPVRHQDSPWEEPANLNDLLLDLIQEKDPVIYAQAISNDLAERVKAKTKIKANYICSQASFTEDLQAEFRYFPHILGRLCQEKNL